MNSSDLQNIYKHAVKCEETITALRHLSDSMPVHSARQETFQALTKFICNTARDMLSKVAYEADWLIEVGEAD